MVFNVLVLGHSQLPVSLPEVTDTAVEIVRKPGGRIADFVAESNSFWRKRYHLAVVYLGGNDLTVLSPHQAWGELRALVERVKEIALTVAVCNAEERHYAETNRFHISPQEYVRNVKNFNAHVRRYCQRHRDRGVRHLSMNIASYRLGREPDQIHFNEQTRGTVLNRLMGLVRNERARQC